MTKQRIIIFVAGITMFVITLLLAYGIGFSSLAGDLFIDLAASSVTIILTALIIDYLNLREQKDKTKNANNLAKDEIRSICTRIEFSLARLYGIEIDRSARKSISSKETAKQYLEELTNQVKSYLSRKDLFKDKSALATDIIDDYSERLQRSQTDLEQTLLLYEYALSYKLKESVLALRNELQISERLLNFVDTKEKLSDTTFSLIQVTSESIYQEAEHVLSYVTQPIR